tara:strand:+ start:29 stop:1168 length:1140 start_codon:yes stop_codon:yes gene_type:complete
VFYLFDVIVIGGGIAGCTTAYYLAGDGVDVLLLEQYEVNALASGANAGSLHAQIQPEPFVDFGERWARRFLPAIPFYAESLSMWYDIEAILGVDLEVSRDGGLVVAANANDMNFLEAKAALEKSVGLETVLLTAAELRDRAPYISKKMVGGALCSIEGKANPLLATPAFAAAAKDRGVVIEQGQRVTEIRRLPDYYEVQCGNRSYRALRVVNAAGTQAGNIASMLDGKIEMQSFPIQLSVTEPVSPLIDHLLYFSSEMLTLKQTKAGTILIGGGWPAVLDKQQQPRVKGSSLYNNLLIAVRTVPAVAAAKIVRTWAAEVNGNQSWLPVIGEMPGSSGFFINYVPWMGLSGALAASRITASLTQGHKPPVDFDIVPFRPG